MGDEGGFAPNIQDNKEGLQLLVEVCVRVRPCVYVCARACVHSSKRAPSMPCSASCARDLKCACVCVLCGQAIANAGYTGKIKIGMDVAASEFYQVLSALTSLLSLSSLFCFYISQSCSCARARSPSPTLSPSSLSLLARWRSLVH